MGFFAGLVYRIKINIDGLLLLFIIINMVIKKNIDGINV
jgi:hypothetical protein